MKKFAPYITAIVLFFILSVIQFKPLYKGKMLSQYDIAQFKGMSKEIADFRQTEHAEPLWTNAMFGGMPSFQISTIYSGNFMSFFDRLFHAFLPGVSGFMFMYFLGFFILLLSLRINPWLALAGSFAFGFSSYFYIIIEVGHNSKANAIGYLAPAIAGVILLMQGRYWIGFAVTALFMALELNANHVQITYYGLLLVGLIVTSYFVKAFKEKQLKPYFIGVMIFVSAMLIALLPNAGNLLCTYEYGKYTTRGKTELTIDPSGKSNANMVTSGLDKDYAVQYSYGVSESFTFLIPNFKGGGSGDQISKHKDALNKVQDPQMRELVGQFSSYYGPQDYTAGPTYVGAIVILLAFLALFIVDHTIKWPLVIGCVFAVMLAWGKFFMPLSSFFLDYMPGYNKFRAVSMINVIAELTIPILAVLALDKLIKSGDATVKLFNKVYTVKKMVLGALIVIGGFCLLCIVSPDMFNSFTKVGEEEEILGSFKRSGYTDDVLGQMFPQFMDALTSARKSIFVDDAMRSFLFIALAFVAIYLFLIKKINARLLTAAFAILLIVDCWPIVWRYLDYSDFVAKSQVDAVPMTKADEEILQDKSLDYRVANLAGNPFSDAITSNHHKSIGGYHGAKLKKYDELIQFHLFKEINYFTGNLNNLGVSDSMQKVVLSGLPVLNMLNTKYFILPTREEPIALRNTESNGNAWFVKSLKTVSSADSEIVALGKTDLKSVGLIQEKNKLGATLKPNYSGAGSIRLVSYKPNHLVYESESAEDQFAVFSEIYYPKGWKTLVDGKEQDHYCVNYLLRGTSVPSGKHKIEFKFEPTVYYTGNTMAYIGSGLLSVLVLLGVFFSWKKGELLKVTESATI